MKEKKIPRIRRGLNELAFGGLVLINSKEVQILNAWRDALIAHDRTCGGPIGYAELKKQVYRRKNVNHASMAKQIFLLCCLGIATIDVEIGFPIRRYIYLKK